MQQLIALTEPDELKAAGIPFRTTDAARWAYRKRHETGLADAFVRLGRRVYVDPERFHALARQSGSTGSAA